jgi:hypothetical protein
MNRMVERVRAGVREADEAALVACFGGSSLNGGASAMRC